MWRQWGSIKIERRKHPLFHKIDPHIFHWTFGRDQYIFSSKKGKISLVLIVNQNNPNFLSIPDYPHLKNMIWELYCLKGDLFQDVERYNQKEAGLRIKELLEEEVIGGW